MEYLFLLGRNIKLSLAEIFSYLEKNKIKLINFYLASNGVLIDVDKELDINKAINDLGGTIAIGNISFQGDIDKIIKEISEKEIYFGVSNKLNYTIFNFCDEISFEKVYSAMKSNFKKERLKSRYHPLRGDLKMQDGDALLGSPSSLAKLGAKYFLFKTDKYFFGTFDEVYNTIESEKRDMERPLRREELAISPRLSKILINLSQVKENEILLDPFCGVGAIIQEALLQNINVVGVDADEKAVKNCNLNISWLKKNYKIDSKYEILNSNSIKAKLKKIDGIVTEPSLGKLLRKIPSEKEAQKMISNFENLIIAVLNNIKKYLKIEGKIAFTSPFIKTVNKRIGINIRKIIEKTGLKSYEINNAVFPIEEFKEGQIVGRKIFVLIKSV